VPATTYTEGHTARRGGSTASIVLWHFPISHFNEKVRWALDWKRIAHARRVLSLGYLPRALWATGRPTLPILFLDGQAIGDSTRIIEALETFQPQPPLYPQEESERRRAVELEDFFDEKLGHPVRTAILGSNFAADPDVVVGAVSTGMGRGSQRAMRAAFSLFGRYYKFRHKIDAASIAAAPRQVVAGLDRIAAELQPSGYLCGDRFSVADLTGAALLAPIVMPPEFPYPPPDHVRQAIAAVRESFAGHAALAWAAEMYRRHRGTSAEIVAPNRHRAASP
jgi:glutathione S-transferase